MKKMKQKIISLILTVVMICAMLPATAFAAGTVAKIGDVKYATLDEAVAAAKDGDTIELLQDATTNGLNLSKDLTIRAADGLAQKPTVTFQQRGIALWGKALTFKNCNVVMDGIGSTPYGEWSWMSICASKDASLTLDNVNMTMDAEGTTNSPHAIYFCNNNVLNLVNDTSLTIKNYANDALEWDGGNGGYNVNITDSTFVSDHNRSGFTGTFYATITNSDVDVINSTGNGSNGSHFVIDHSKVNFNDNGSHGLSAGNLTIKNHSIVTANDNGMYGVTYTGTMSMDGTSVLNAIGNASSTSGGGLRAANSTTVSTVESGAKVTIEENLHNGLENYGTFTFEDGAELTITDNDERTSNGGGIFNGSYGVLTLPDNAVIMNNHAGQTGAGICNAGTVTFGENTKLYNNHADQAGDDIYNRDGGTVNGIPAIGKGWSLDGGEDCNGEEHRIDGWYDDAADSRWQAHAENSDENHIEKYEQTEINGLKALKAAHGTEAVDKASYPSLDKTTNGEEETSVSAGGTVDFELTSNVPEDLTNYLDPDDVATPSVMPPVNALSLEGRGSYTLTFHDEMDERLTLDTNSISVTIKGNVVDKALYETSFNPTDDCTFEVSMDLVKLFKAGYFTKEDFGTADIVVEYTATASEKLTNGEYLNTAWVVYEGGESEKDTVTVYSYRIDIFKYDQNNPTTGLQGAEFEIYQKDEENNKINAHTFSSDRDGNASWNGLAEGTYYIKETKAPEGYVCSEEELTIEIPDQAGADQIVNVRFANSNIPHTGGTGTRMFTIGGAAIIVAAGVILVVSRRKRED